MFYWLKHTHNVVRPKAMHTHTHIYMSNDKLTQLFYKNNSYFMHSTFFNQYASGCETKIATI